MKILIVDDEPKVRKVVDELIRAAARGEERVSIGEAGSLGEALDWLFEQHPDAIICDGHFPIGTLTRKTLRKMGEDYSWAMLWAVAVNAGKRFGLFTGDPALLEWARTIGVRAFPKPEGLSAAIKYLLKSARKEEPRGG